MNKWNKLLKQYKILAINAEAANLMRYFNCLSIYDRVAKNSGMSPPFDLEFPPDNHLEFRLYHNIPAQFYYGWLKEHGYKY